ncbi:histidine triad nucleotide-binding protein 3-like [Thrips palmi]|uniref:Adenosine 5'-monophosphoramidase HINT3 n=1 Tax=Thrips palmi TaxID=161013 RepID=A0A6P8YUU0_THRPL|nr:histidine triad nucleotide-binding protein 3-like [Thrips palmi]
MRNMKWWFWSTTVFCCHFVTLQNVVFRAGRCVTCRDPGDLIDSKRRLSVSAYDMSEKPPANCIFCQICGDNPSGTELVVSAEDLVVFRDIKPAAKHHFLVVSRQHIRDAKAMTSEHKPLLQRMVSVAEQVLRDHDADMTDYRLGFHWPPFHSISHLHLHAISPTADMGFMARLIFKPNTWWFVPPEYVMSRL